MTDTRTVSAVLTKSSATAIRRALVDLQALLDDGWVLDRLRVVNDAKGQPVLRIVVR